VLADIESTGDLKPAGVAANDLSLRTQDECQDNQQASEASSESTREIVINLDVPRKVSKHESGTYKPPAEKRPTTPSIQGQHIPKTKALLDSFEYGSGKAIGSSQPEEETVQEEKESEAENSSSEDDEEEEEPGDANQTLLPRDCDANSAGSPEQPEPEVMCVPPDVSAGNFSGPALADNIDRDREGEEPVVAEIHFQGENLTEFEKWYNRVCVYGIDVSFVHQLWSYVERHDTAK
jgi:hypothetical protein